jgi:hypothetical protein
LNQVRAVGHIRRVALLECIPSQGDISLRELLRKSSHLFSNDELQKELKQLEADHFVCSSEHDRYSRFAPNCSDENLIVAVEVKLSKIEEVLAQARANLAFADQSFIGIPIANAERLTNLERHKGLISSGVGLLGVERGRCEVLIGSGGDKSKTNPAVRAHCIERFWRTFIDNGA